MTDRLDIGYEQVVKTNETNHRNIERLHDKVQSHRGGAYG